jgi:hypothetical protein
MAMYDDQATYFRGLIDFIRDVDRERSPLAQPVAPS